MHVNNHTCADPKLVFFEIYKNLVSNIVYFIGLGRYVLYQSTVNSSLSDNVVHFQKIFSKCVPSLLLISKILSDSDLVSGTDDRFRKQVCKVLGLLPRWYHSFIVKQFSTGVERGGSGSRN